MLRGGASRSFSETGYARYWHGYLIYVKPLLCLFSFGMIRKVGVVLQALLLVCILWRLVKVRRPLVALGFWLGYVTVSVKAIGYCLQYWPATFGMLFTSLAIVLMWERKAVSLSRLSLLFTITGAAINYFDFLTYPLVTLVVPLLLLFALEGSSDPRRALSVFVVCALSWALAYALMWILKWLLATVLTGQNVFADAAAQAKYRSLASDSGEDVSYFQSLQRSLYRYANNTFNIAVAGFTVFSVVCLYLDARMNCEKLRLMARLAVPVILAIALVLLWYLGMLEHCWLHSVIVNRHFWTLGFGFSLGSASLLEALYHGDPSRQGCEI